MQTLRISFVCLLTTTLTSTARADVKLPAVISEHMVLQAEMAVPIWGWAEPNEAVTVTFAGQLKKTEADAAGNWKVTLDKLAVAAEPQTLTVEGKNKLTVGDVLVGEVWLGSGQSNMAMTVSGSLHYDQEQAAANLPTLRMFTVARASTPEPQRDCTGQWVVCSPESVGRFSATLYFFGRDVQKEVKQPLGLINSSWGGTAIEAWMSIPTQSKLAVYPEIDKLWAANVVKPWDQAAQDAKYQQALAAWKEAAKQAKAAGKPVGRGPQPPVAPRLQPNHPGNLFNGMIEPLIPFAFRGAVWYQGESNSNRAYNVAYGEQLRTMIGEWRARFGHEFPFAWVQLPDYKAPQKDPVEADGWPVIREQMLNTLAVPHTGMAVCLGLGEEKDIHPKNKQGVGNRLAQWALANVYNRSVVASGPLPTGHKISGGEIVVTFKYADGLKARDGELTGFAIAGADKQFVWAKARIEGDKVIVSSPDVPQPTAVRYAWAANPKWRLVNAAGLPATPFRTDVE
jgi:hypothetical protein